MAIQLSRRPASSRGAPLAPLLVIMYSEDGWLVNPLRVYMRAPHAELMNDVVIVIIRLRGDPPANDSFGT